MFSIWIYCKIIYFCDIKAVFSASLLQSSVSHDPPEIIIIWFALETFIITNVENMVVLLHIFGESFFPQDFFKNRKFKRTAFIKKKSYNIINVVFYLMHLCWIRVSISYTHHTHTHTHTHTLTILPKVLGPLLMKGLTTLVSMSTNLNVYAYNDIVGNCVLLIL